MSDKQWVTVLLLCTAMGVMFGEWQGDFFAGIWMFLATLLYIVANIK